MLCCEKRKEFPKQHIYGCILVLDAVVAITIFGECFDMRNANPPRNDRETALDALSMAAHNRPRFTLKLSSCRRCPAISSTHS